MQKIYSSELPEKAPGFHLAIFKLSFLTKVTNWISSINIAGYKTPFAERLAKVFCLVICSGNPLDKIARISK